MKIITSHMVQIAKVSQVTVGLPVNCNILSLTKIDSTFGRLLVFSDHGTAGDLEEATLHFVKHKEMVPDGAQYLATILMDDMPIAVFLDVAQQEFRTL